MTPFNPDDWMDVLALSIMGVTSAAGLIVPAIFLHVRQGRKIDRIDNQVTNQHEENLRDEITRGFREVRDDIKGLREELRTERIERIEGDKNRLVFNVGD